MRKLSRRGFAGAVLAGLLRPRSTVDQSSAPIGEKAADLLSERMESKIALPVERVFIPPRLVLRESSSRRTV